MTSLQRIGKNAVQLPVDPSGSPGAVKSGVVWGPGSPWTKVPCPFLCPPPSQLSSDHLPWHAPGRYWLKCTFSQSSARPEPNQRFWGQARDLQFSQTPQVTLPKSLETTDCDCVSSFSGQVAEGREILSVCWWVGPATNNRDS